MGILKIAEELLSSLTKEYYRNSGFERGEKGLPPRPIGLKGESREIYMEGYEVGRKNFDRKISNRF